MLAINTEEQLAIYSLGKTGTTSFLESIKDKEHWHGVGELDAQFMNDLYNIPEQGVYGWTKGYVDQLTALEMLVNDRNYKPIFIVRDPWKRYVSGIMEILQDTFNVVMNHQDYLRMLRDMGTETFTKQLDRLYYLSEFERQKEQNDILLGQQRLDLQEEALKDKTRVAEERIQTQRDIAAANLARRS